MTEAIVRAEPAALDFNNEQRQLIRDTFANGASDAEFAVLLEVAKARRLNPFTRQIYFVKRYDSQKRREVWATQASIDGLRAIAQRTGLYDGQDEPEYEYDDKGKIATCRVKVYRKDWRRPAVGVAHWDEYAQKKQDGGLNTFWATKGHIMLAKCAEALALRKAFPEDLSGLYAPEEMGQAPMLPESNGEQSNVKTWLNPADDARESPYASQETVASFIEDLSTATVLANLKAIWRDYVPTPEAWEDFAPEDRKEIQKLFKRRERELSKAESVIDTTGDDL